MTYVQVMLFSQFRPPTRLLQSETTLSGVRSSSFALGGISMSCNIGRYSYRSGPIFSGLGLLVPDVLQGVVLLEHRIHQDPAVAKPPNLNLFQRHQNPQLLHLTRVEAPGPCIKKIVHMENQQTP